ncbi:outer membrane beta-barrel protein [Flavisolibacter nicotianae]|uniref:outer membrane beta-barrel protein n=1 Tax=Flavisolibacter nicotianae TaxID=2364882 RepID=UPI000EB4B8A5|nr:outer membrane beta-barrel protein [Flavisolibacter nicotianae]
MKKAPALCVLLLFVVSVAFAQGSIKGKLLDSAGKNPLGLATITVFKAADTALITYRLSNPEGEFKVPGLPLNLACRIVVTYTGYEAFRKEFTLTGEETLDMGNIKLQPTAKSLDEVIVVAERPPVTVRKDTIEFNASSFKTLPTHLVEDLLRKLPGVQVDRDGNITANGKRVNRIMVDGKSFFGDDPKMATRNLPANVIDKVQVTDDKDEIARNSDGDLTNVGQVINLTLKKGVKKGWFGKLYGGAGTNDRYELGGIANIYRDTMQLSLLGFSNNINRSGFSFKEIQDIGGFNRSGFNSVMISNRSGQTGFALNGISFGGLDAGIARTTGGGFNLNHAPNKKNSFFLQYFFGNTHNNVQQLTNVQQFFNDTAVNTLTTTGNNRVANTHNLGAGANLKPDTLTDITFRSGYAYSTSADAIAALINVTNNLLGQVSSGTGSQFNKTYYSSYNHSLTLTRRFREKKGRTLNLSHFLTYTSNLQRYITEAENDYFYPFPYDRDFAQLRRQDLPSLSANTNLNFSEPLSKKMTLRFNNQYNYIKDEQDIAIFNRDGNAKYELPDDTQAKGFQRYQHRVNSYLGLSYKIKQVTLSAGVNGLWQTIHNNFTKVVSPVNTTLFNVLPSFQFSWKQLSAQVNQSVTAPSVSNLTPVPDSTNPFYIRYGNPYLKPAKRTSFYINNFIFLQGSSTSFNFFANGNFTDNDVVLKKTVAANGVQTTMPVNASGTVNFYGSVGYGKEFKNKQKFIFSFRFSPYVNYDRRKLIVNNNVSTASSLQFGPNFNLSFNWNDKVEMRPMYSPGISRTTYTDPGFKSLRAVTHYLENELIVRLPAKLVWETNVAYRYNSEVAPGLPKENLLWNAAVTLLMLKGDVGMLKLSVFDILNRNNGFYRFTSQNQITDQRTNVLQRYGALTFTYNIRNMGAPKKVGGRDRLFFF